MKDSLVLNDTYFGNLTIKGIKEIELGGTISLAPVTWGWFCLVVFIALMMFYKYYKRKEFMRENAYIFNFVEKVQLESIDETSIYKMIKIIAKKKYSLSSSQNFKIIQILDPENKFFNKNLDEDFFDSIYTSKNMNNDKLLLIKEQTLNWMRSLVS